MRGVLAALPAASTVRATPREASARAGKEATSRKRRRFNDASMGGGKRILAM
jgi:hypothetical protein